MSRHDLSDAEIFQPPPRSPLERIEWDEQSRRRRRGANFFWISFAVFVTTIIAAVLPLVDMFVPGRGGHIGVLGEFIRLWLAAVAGVSVAIASSVIAIVTSKRGANLLMTEVALLTMLLFWMFRPVQ